MSAKSSRNLLVHLREMDERYAQVEPTRGAEARLLHRLETQTSPQTNARGLAWRTAWRPVAFVAACVIVLAFSLRDEIPVTLRGHFRPLHRSVPAKSTDESTPMPNMPRRQDSTFHDSIAPAATPSNEPSPRVLPAPKDLREWPAPPDDSIDAPHIEPRRRIHLSYRSSPFDKPTARAFNNSSGDVYLSTAPESKTESAPRSGGSSSRTTRSPSAAHDESADSNSSPVCQSPESFKISADLDCSEKGFALVELTLLDPCGNGQFRQETHECAETELDACVTVSLGDGTTCQDPGQFKTLAYEACSAAGQQLTDLVYDMSDCGGKTKMATFTCCTPAPQQAPANPPSCYEMTTGDGSICKDYGTIKLESSDLCAIKGGYLFDLKFGGECPDGQASNVSIVCCGP